MANSDDISIIIGVQAQEVVKAGKKLDGMRSSVASLNKMLNKGTISNVQYEKGLRELARANDVVLGSRQKSTSVIRRMKKEIEALSASDIKAGKAVKITGKEVDRLASKMDKASTSAKRLGKNMSLAGKKTNRLGSNLQQVGYQVGDFAVQIQGGTNAAVALGQQGAQLLGIFGPVGALAGAALAIGTAIVAPLMRGKEEAANLVDRIKDLKRELAELKGLSLPPELEAAFNEQSKIDLSILKKELQIASLKEDSERLGKDAKVGSVTISERLIAAELQLTNLIDKRKASQEVINSFNRVSINLSKQKTADQIRLMENQVALSEEEARSGTKSKEYRDEVIRQELETLAIESLRSQVHDADIKILLKNKRAVLEAEFRTLDILEAQRKKAADKAEAEAKAAKDKAAKDKAQADYEKRYAAALRNYAVLQGRMDAKTAEEKASASRAYYSNIYVQLAESKKAGDELAKSALEAYLRGEDLSKLDVGKGVSAAALAAGELARNLGISVSEALRMVNLGSAGGGRGRVIPDAVDVSAMAAGGITLPSYKKSKPVGGGGGKDPRKQLAEYLESKRQELELETKLVGIFGDERDIQTELFNTKNQYSEVITTKQKEELENILRLTLAEKERTAVLEEAKSSQEALADQMANSMGNAFTSMVDGTMSVKDAFKSMARDIIKQLWQVIVVQRIVGSAKEGTGIAGFFSKVLGASQADGGAWQGGSQVQAYANGGVVNGPTTFGMSGGKIGLMGEAGPEAIMPLKRGSNGKLGVQMEGSGGGDTIVVHQNFNFQSNGDDSIKKLIAQAAPQISAMTKSSLLNDRRRGGATKAAFG